MRTAKAGGVINRTTCRVAARRGVPGSPALTFMLATLAGAGQSTPSCHPPAVAGCGWIEADTTATTIRTQAATALGANKTYVAVAAPTVAQNTGQTKTFARQMNGLIRLILGHLDGTD